MNSDQIVAIVNKTLRFLALRKPDNCSSVSFFDKISTPPIDVLIFPGCDLLSQLSYAKKIFSAGLNPYIVLTGGIGHSTHILRKNAEKYWHLQNYHSLCEAEIMLNTITNFYHLPANTCFIEPDSSNSGENAIFTHELLQKKGVKHNRILIIHDPLMQRRTDAGWRKIFFKSTLFSFAPFIPQIDSQFNILCNIPDKWSKDRFFTLMLGEMCRLLNTPEGYGPSGKGWIEKVDLPDSFTEDYEILCQYFAQYKHRIIIK